MKRRLRKILAETIAVAIVTFLSLLLILSIPQVQSFLGARILNWLSASLNTEMEVSDLRITATGKLAFEDLLIRDQKSDTLIYVPNFDAFLDQWGLISGKVEVKSLKMVSPYVKVVKYEGENQNSFANFLSNMKGDGGSGKKFEVASSYFAINKAVLKYIDQGDADKNISIHDLALILEDIDIKPDDIGVNLERLSLNQENGLKLEKLSGIFQLNKEQLKLQEFEFATPNSKFRMNFEMQVREGQLVLRDWKKASISLDIPKSIIDLNEVKQYISSDLLYDKVILSSSLRGKLDDLRLEYFSLDYIDGTKLLASGDIKEIADSSNREVDLYIQEFTASIDAINTVLLNMDKKQLPSQLDTLQYITISGPLRLGTNEINSNLDIVSAVGGVVSSLSYKGESTIEDVAYRGSMELVGLDLGALLNDSRWGEVYLNFDLDGTGLQLETFDTLIEGEISSLEYSDYYYSDIAINGKMKPYFFSGEISTIDENIDLEITGEVDLSQELKKIAVDAFIDRLDMAAIGMVQDSIAYLESAISIRAQGTQLADWVGEVNLTNTNFENIYDSYYFEDINITSDINSYGLRKLAVNSQDVVEGEVVGKYRIRDLGKITANAIGKSFKNFNPHPLDSGQFYNYRFYVHNTFLSLLDPKLQLAPNTYFSGSSVSDKGVFQFEFSSPRIRYGRVLVDSVYVLLDNQNQRVNSKLTTGQILNPAYDFSELNLNVDQLRDTLFITTQLESLKEGSASFELHSYQTIDSLQHLVFGFKKSILDFKDNVWYFNEDDDDEHKIIYDNHKEIALIRPFGFTSDKKGFYFEGEIYDSTSANFELKMDEVPLQRLLPKSERWDFKGVLDGSAVFNKNGKELLPRVDLRLDDAILNEQLLGDAVVRLDWLDAERKIKTYINIAEGDLEHLNLDGDVLINNADNPLEMDLRLNKFTLAPLAPILKGALDNIRGYATGDFKVTGPLKAPLLNGDLTLQRGGLGIPYLNIDLNIDGAPKVPVRDSFFYFTDIPVADSKEGTGGILNGSITHLDWKLWYLDLNIDAEQMMVLNTTEKENEYFYGKVYATGDLRIFGPTSRLNFDLKAKTERGSRFSIPIADTKVVQESGFIKFKAPPMSEQDSLLALVKRKKVKKESKGLMLNFDLEVTKDAEMELIFDKTVGDIIRGRGYGNFDVQIDTKGDFTMYGTYDIYSGDYLFTLKNLVNKRFAIRPGGTITWEGNPYDAILDLTAIYTTRTNPAGYLQSVTTNTKQEVDLELHLKEVLSNPTFEFDISMPRAPENVKSELRYRLSEADQMNQQFITLLTFNSFVNSGSETSYLGTGITETTTEMISNQISNMMSKMGGDIDIGINYTQASAGAPSSSGSFNPSDELEVMLSSQLFDDRVTVNGAVGVPVGSTQSSLVGDVEIEVNISEDGRFRGTVFNRSERNYNIIEQQGYVQGVGLSYREEFDTFGELGRLLVEKITGKKRKERKKAKEASEEELPVEEAETSDPSPSDEKEFFQSK